MLIFVRAKACFVNLPKTLKRSSTGLNLKAVLTSHMSKLELSKYRFILESRPLYRPIDPLESLTRPIDLPPYPELTRPMPIDPDQNTKTIDRLETLTRPRPPNQSPRPPDPPYQSHRPSRPPTHLRDHLAEGRPKGLFQSTPWACTLVLKSSTSGSVCSMEDQGENTALLLPDNEEENISQHLLLPQTHPPGGGAMGNRWN